MSWNFDERNNRSISIFTKLSLSINNAILIPLNYIDDFYNGKINYTAINIVRDLAISNLIEADFIEALDCISQWKNLNIQMKSRSSISTLSTPGYKNTPSTNVAASPFSPSSNPTTLWGYISQNTDSSINTKTILLVLYSLMHPITVSNGNIESSQEELDNTITYSNLCLYSAILYINLLDLPSSFTLHNPLILRSVFNLCTLFSKTHVEYTFLKRKDLKKKEIIDIDNIEISELLTLQDFVSNYAISGVIKLLESLSNVIEHVHFDDDSFLYSIESIISLTRMPTIWTNTFSNDINKKLENIQTLSFQCLKKCTLPVHGDWNNTIPAILRNILPSLLGVPKSFNLAGFKNTLPAKVVNCLRASSTEFLIALLNYIINLSENPVLPTNIGSDMAFVSPAPHLTTPHLSSAALAHVRRRISIQNSTSKARKSALQNKHDEEIALTVKASQDVILGWWYILLQHICIKSTDKADGRSLASTSIVELLHKCPFQIKGKLLSLFFTFLIKFSKTGKVQYRMLSIDLALNILNDASLLTYVLPLDATCISISAFAASKSINKRAASEREEDDNEVAEIMDFSSSADDSVAVLSDLPTNSIINVMLDILLKLSNDKAASVRAKSLNCLAEVISYASDAAAPSILDSQMDSDSMLLLAPSNKELSQLLRNGLNSTLSLDASSSNSNLWTLINFLLNRFCDSKALVRRASLMALVGILECFAVLEKPEIGSQISKVLEIVVGCLNCSISDQSVVIRKESLNLCSRLLKAFPQNLLLRNSWLKGTLSSVLDVEASVSDKAKSLILDNLLIPAFNLLNLRSNKAKKNEVFTLETLEKLTSSNTVGNTSWSMFDAISRDSSLLSALQSAVEYFIKQNLITSEIYSSLNLFLESASVVENLAWDTPLFHGSWLMLDELSKYTPNKFHSENIATLASIALSSGTDNPLIKCRVIRVMGRMHANIPLQGKNPVLNSLTPETCGEFIVALFERISSLGDAPETGVTSACIRTLHSLITAIVLKNESFKDSLPKWEEMLSHSIKERLEAFVSKKEFIPSEEIVSNLFVLGELFFVSNCSNLNSILPIIVSILSSNAETIIRIHSLLTLGKICLKSESVAKKNISFILKELDSDNFEMRNNAFLIVCDLARIYTSLVEDYFDLLSCKLVDSNYIVRYHAISQITSLISEDFIKLKDATFFRLCYSLTDKDERIRDIAELFFRNIIAVKMPHVISQHLVECLFYFNCCVSHPSYNRFGARDKIFGLKSNDSDISHDLVHGSNHLNNSFFYASQVQNSFKRHWIYAKLLSFLNDEQKFQVTAKLSQEVVGNLVESIIPFEESSLSVLKDALLLLASHYIKLSVSKASNDDEEDDKEAKIAHATGKVLSQMVKKNFLENVVPLLIELKGILEKQHSPLLKYLMSYLREFLLDYKKDLSEVISDKQISKELEFDINQWERSQKPVVHVNIQPPSLSLNSQLATPLFMSAKKSKYNNATPIAAVNFTPKLKDRNASLMNFEVEDSPENKNNANIINVALEKSLSKTWSIMELEPVLEEVESVSSKKQSKKSAKTVESSKPTVSKPVAGEVSERTLTKIAINKKVEVPKQSDGGAGRSSRSRAKIL